MTQTLSAASHSHLRWVGPAQSSLQVGRQMWLAQTAPAAQGANPVPATSSSTWPSQSLSCPSQTSSSAAPLQSLSTPSPHTSMAPGFTLGSASLQSVSAKNPSLSPSRAMVIASVGGTLPSLELNDTQRSMGLSLLPKSGSCRWNPQLGWIGAPFMSASPLSQSATALVTSNIHTCPGAEETFCGREDQVVPLVSDSFFSSHAQMGLGLPIFLRRVVTTLAGGPSTSLTSPTRMRSSALVTLPFGTLPRSNEMYPRNLRNEVQLGGVFAQASLGAQYAGVAPSAGQQTCAGFFLVQIFLASAATHAWRSMPTLMAGSRPWVLPSSWVAQVSWAGVRSTCFMPVGSPLARALPAMSRQANSEIAHRGRGPIDGAVVRIADSRV